MHFLIHALSLFGKESRCTAAGVAIKNVTCERCFLPYAYRLHRRVTAKAGGLPGVDQARAHLNAQHRLHMLLQREIDSVPCPRCGWYQARMVRKIRKRHLRVLWNIGLILLAVAPFLAFVAILLQAFDVEIGPAARNPITRRIVALSATTALVLGGCLTVTKLVMAQIYDPNSHDEDLRRELGQSLACIREDLEADDR